MSKVRVLSDRLIVKPDEAPVEKVTATGIVLPNVSGEVPLQGVVTHVGPGRLNPDGTLVKMTVFVGERIVYGRSSGVHITIDGEKRILMREGDVYAVIEE